MKWLRSNWLNLVAIGILLGAIGHQPDAYYKLLRCVVCGVAGYSAYRYYRSDNKLACIVLAIVSFTFNPVMPFHFARFTWQVLDVAASVVFLLSLLLQRAKLWLWRCVELAAWGYVLAVPVAGFYANGSYPHGPLIATGELVCENDDHGPCGEEMVEDTRRLAVPEWVQFMRGNALAVVISLMGAGAFALYLGTRRQEVERLMRAIYIFAKTKPNGTSSHVVE